MGRGQSPPPPSSTPPDGGALDGGSSSIIDLLQQILDVLKSVFTPNASKGHVEIRTLATGATFQRLYEDPKHVKSAIIQNISTEDVTLMTGARAEALTAGQGILLNAATVAGKGGGSVPVGNIDLRDIFFVRTTAGVTLSVYFEN